MDFINLSMSSPKITLGNYDISAKLCCCIFLKRLKSVIEFYHNKYIFAFLIF